MRLLLLALVAILAPAGAARAQTADELGQQGIRAYRRAEFEAAAAFFRRALDFAARDSVASRNQSVLLDYLGAAELFYGRRDTAIAVFRRVVHRDPRHQLDEVIFPPEVTSLLDEVRRGTKTLVVAAAADTTIPLNGGTWAARLVATSFQQAIATIRNDSGAVIRELYSGPVEDSLTVRWNATNSLNRPVAPGRYQLSVESSSGGRTTRLLRIPLIVGLILPDTLPLPLPIPDSLILPERVSGKRALGGLLAGVSVGAAASVLPLLVAHGSTPTPARFIIGGTVGLAAIVGISLHPPSRPIPANIGANRTRRDAWQAEHTRVRNENARRRATAGIRIQAGAATATGSGIP